MCYYCTCTMHVWILTIWCGAVYGRATHKVNSSENHAESKVILWHVLNPVQNVKFQEVPMKIYFSFLLLSWVSSFQYNVVSNYTDKSIILRKFSTVIYFLLEKLLQ